MKTKISNKDFPLFSILIANYNNGDYLMDAIESVFKQTYSNWEIIIVDDKSTDKSYEQYKSIAKDERIHVYFNEVNKGCGYTKARCIDVANGEFCGFLDPDDLLMPEAIEKTIEILRKDSSISLVSSKMFMADKNLKIDGESYWSCKIPDNSSFLEFGNCAITPFAAFRTDSYKKTRGLRRDALRAIDHYLYYLLEEVGRVEFIPDCLYVYRRGTGNNISLGMDNGLKALLWDLIAMQDACIRRKKPIEDILFKNLNDYLVGYNWIQQEKGRTEIRDTNSFKVGHIILSPFRYIKNIFN